MMTQAQPEAVADIKNLSDAARIKASHLVSAATLVPTASLNFSSKPDSNGTTTEYRIECFHAADLPEELKEWTFQLVKSNMESIYKTASWPWEDSEKRKEMLEPEGRYLIVYPVGGTEPVGMTYFQFVLEDDGDSDDNKQLGCIYCYEIQLTPGIQGKGIGSHLMHLLEDMGRRLGMRKCMLTVLRINKQATSFYQKLGYSIDLISPSKCLPKHKWKKIPYEILSRKL